MVQHISLDDPTAMQECLRSLDEASLLDFWSKLEHFLASVNLPAKANSFDKLVVEELQRRHMNFMCYGQGADMIAR